MTTEITTRENWIVIRRTPFNGAYIQAFKEMVPHQCREWDAEDKCWYIESSFADQVDKLIERHFSVRNGVTWSLAWMYLHLRKSAPPEVIKAVAKVLLDSAPDPESRQKIEAARWLLLNL